MKIAKVLLAAAAFAWAVGAGAQAYPARPIRLIVPFTPGGTPDLSARLIAQKLGAKWGQPIVVENRPGAGSTLGADMVSRSPNDGYTWLMASDGTMVINPLTSKVPYDPFKDFTPVTEVARVPFLLVVNSSLPVHSVADLLAYGKAHPGELNFGSAGKGTPQHLAGELLRIKGGIDMTHVPYQGAAPAVADLVAGRVQVFIGSPNTLVAQIQDGKLRALASAGSRRSDAFPDLPTISETLPGVAMDIWLGIFMPANVPDAIVQKVQADIATALNEPGIKKDLAEKQYLEVETPGPAALTSLVRNGRVLWGQVIRDAGLKID